MSVSHIVRISGCAGQQRRSIPLFDGSVFDKLTCKSVWNMRIVHHIKGFSQMEKIALVGKHSSAWPLDKKVARRGGFEPPSPFGHWISNPTPYRAGPSPPRFLRIAMSFLNVSNWVRSPNYNVTMNGKWRAGMYGLFVFITCIEIY
jgi:hypothetical protein